MDEASKLVLELQRKLTELDHKVALYRKDMNDEFTKYEEDLLRNVPRDISHKVSTIIAGSLNSYKALYPDASSFDSCAASNNQTTVTSSSPDAGSGSDTRTIPHANGIPKPTVESQIGSSTSVVALPFHKRDEDMERPRSPHEREKEFTGVFTPSYLPLLDSSSRYDRQPATMDSEDKPKDKQLEALQVDASTDTRSLAASPDLGKPPTPLRKNTDEISIASDVSSDGPVRRSALRRSSSYNKGSSPRRVRFDVEGQEVLPTVSPQDTTLESSIPLSAFGDDSDDEAGAEQVEDIDAPVPPKRISSSQALRALSRGPFEEDGVQWTTVSAPPDGSASVDTSKNGTFRKDDDVEPTPIPTHSQEENARPIPIPAKTSEADLSPRIQHVEAPPTKDEADIDVLSEDDMLDMPPLRPVRSQTQNPPSASILSPIRTEHDEFTSSPHIMRTPSKPLTLEPLEPQEAYEKLKFNEEDDDHDDLFHFDETLDRESSSPPEDQDHDDSDTEEASSPGVEEARPPVVPTPAKGIVGSYKGRPFSMPVVSDEVHARAASLGNMNSFVGSVNGRSGLDESDVLSFRASGGMGSFSMGGTPRSMSERLMMEDLMEGEEGGKGS
ncbi:hypothetical protein CJF32_00009593 [Rutstroemia sp. NJR-2017a WRK4]|nr:hypothetical protein CJF32_00009593 [Rutstroemia sp. NJR-2017a WRK4]